MVETVDNSQTAGVRYYRYHVKSHQSLIEHLIGSKIGFIPNVVGVDKSNSLNKERLKRRQR